MAGGRLYQEFLRVPSISAGLYVLEAGADDPQRPHQQDEIYYVIAGRAQIRVDGEDRPVQAGSVVFVAKHVEHRFHSIEQRLRAAGRVRACRDRVTPRTGCAR